MSKLNLASLRIEEVGREDESGLGLIAIQLVLLDMALFCSLPASLLEKIAFARVIGDHPLVTRAEEFLTAFNDQSLVVSKINRSLRVSVEVDNDSGDTFTVIISQLLRTQDMSEPPVLTAIGSSSAANATQLMSGEGRSVVVTTSAREDVVMVATLAISVNLVDLVVNVLAPLRYELISDL